MNETNPQINKDLKNYWNMLFPETLQDNEYIRILGLKEKDGNKITNTWFIKTVEELQAIIKTNQHKYNLYCNLSTVLGKNGDTESQYRRKVIMLDFDRKDFNGDLDFKKVVTLFKEKFYKLYYRAIYDTGNGFHLYIITDETENIKELADINKSLAVAVGADAKAAQVTQVARIPTSYNIKDKKHKYVSTIINDLKARPTQINELRKATKKLLCQKMKLFKQKNLSHL